MGYKKVVELLLKHGDTPVNAKNKNGDGPIVMAAKHGKEDIVGQLLRRDGIDVNLEDSGGKTALEWAREKGNEKMIKMLEDK